MRIQFADKKLERLFVEDGYKHPKKFDGVLVRQYIRRVTLIQSVQNQLELRNHKALHLEKLRGSCRHQHSVRLDGQWRLILEFKKDADGQIVVVIDIADYH